MSSKNIVDDGITGSARQVNLFHDDVCNRNSSAISQSVSCDKALKFEKSYFIDCHSSGNGGVASVTSSSITITSCSFVQAKADSHGGIIFWHPTSHSASSSISLSCGWECSSHTLAPAFYFTAPDYYCSGNFNLTSLTANYGSSNTLAMHYTGSLDFTNSNLSRSKSQYQSPFLVQYIESTSIKFSTFEENREEKMTINFLYNFGHSISTCNFLNNTDGTVINANSEKAYDVQDCFFFGIFEKPLINPKTVIGCSFNMNLTEYAAENSILYTGASNTLECFVLDGTQCIFQSKPEPEPELEQEHVSTHIHSIQINRLFYFATIAGIPI